MNPFDEKLAQFCEDEVMLNAVKQTVFSHCDLNTLKRDDPMLSDMARARLDAREILANAFKEIETYRRKASSTTNTDNPNNI